MLYVNIPVTKKNKLSETSYFWIVVFDHLSFGQVVFFYSSGPGEATKLLKGVRRYDY